MVIKVYISRVSGNLEIRKRQDFISAVLKAKKIDFEEIDISDAANEEGKLFMRENSKAAGDASNILPPQIFNNSTYCGDYNGFHEANENDGIHSFLHIDQ